MLRRILPLINGLGLIVFGIVFMIVLPKKAESKIARCTAETMGKVTDCTEQYDDDGTTYDITVSFEVNGKSYTDITNQSEMVDIGHEYKVFYNPDDPGDYLIEGLYSTSKQLSLFGLGALVIGVLVTIYQLFRLMRGR